MRYIVDLSDWQEDVPWESLVSNGFTGVIIKLGERDYLCSTLADKVAQASTHGLSVGFYYYSHALSEPEATHEAEWVAYEIQVNYGMEPELGIWFDYEDTSILDSGVDMTTICNSFVNRVHELGYSQVGIYSSYNWLTNYIRVSDIGNVPLWVAQYNSQDDFSLENPSANVHLWQFTDKFSEELPYDASVLYE